MALFFAGVIALFVVAEVIFLFQKRTLDAAREQNAALQEEIEALRSLAGANKELEAAAAELEERRDAVRSMGERRGDVLDRLRATVSVLPDGVWLESLSADGEGLLLQGGAPDGDLVAAYLEDLELSPCAGQVALLAMEDHGQVDGAQRFRVRVEQRGYEPADAAACNEAVADLPPGALMKDPFRSPLFPDDAPDPTAVRPLARFRVSQFDLLVVTQGDRGREALLRDPDGQTHRVIVGTPLGRGRARVSEITPDVVIITEEELLDADTGRSRTHLTTLRMRQGG